MASTTGRLLKRNVWEVFLKTFWNKWRGRRSSTTNITARARLFDVMTTWLYVCLFMSILSVNVTKCGPCRRWSVRVHCVVFHCVLYDLGLMWTTAFLYIRVRVMELDANNTPNTRVDVEEAGFNVLKGQKSIISNWATAALQCTHLWETDVGGEARLTKWCGHFGQCLLSRIPSIQGICC